MYSDIDTFNITDKPTSYTAKHILMLHSNLLHVSAQNRNTWNCFVQCSWYSYFLGCGLERTQKLLANPKDVLLLVQAVQNGQAFLNRKRRWSIYTGVLISPQPDILPDVFCLMVRIFRLLLVLLYIQIVLINIPPIMIINRLYETQNLLSLQLVSFLVGLRTYQHHCNTVTRQC